MGDPKVNLLTTDGSPGRISILFSGEEARVHSAAAGLQASLDGGSVELFHVLQDSEVEARLENVARSGQAPQLVVSRGRRDREEERRILAGWRRVVGDLEWVQVEWVGTPCRRDEASIHRLPAEFPQDSTAMFLVEIARRIEQARRFRLDLQRERCEREMRSAEIRETESRFAAAFRSLPVPLALVTPDRGRIVEANDRLLQLVGRDVLGMIGYTLEESGWLLEPETWRRLLRRMAVEERVRDEPLGMRCGTRILDTKVTIEPIGLPDSRLLLLIVDDQTERLALEGQLRHSQKLEAVGQLAAAVAHDFNNLLTVIDGYTGLLLARDDLQEEVEEDVRRIAQASESASALTRKLLAFSRKQVLQPRPVPLNEHVLSLQDMLTRLIGEQVELRFELGPGAPTVMGDPSGIEQVILNLALNARDAMPSGGVVTIGTTVREWSALHPVGDSIRPGRFLELSVSDTGTGMSEEVRSRIFEPFFTTKEPGKGTGLGLSTVLAIVRQHGGWVDVRSRPGEGTLVAAYFPVVQSAAPEARKGVSRPAAVPAGIRVLLVEDEESVRSYARLVLTRAGFEVSEAENGDSALELWRAQEGAFGLVVTDMVMPGTLTGGALALALRRERPDVPILFISGYSAEVAGSDLVTESVFLAKPFSPGALLSKVQGCLDAQAAA